LIAISSELGFMNQAVAATLESLGRAVSAPAARY